MRKILLSLILLTIIGIIPTLLVILISKFTVLAIITGIVAIGLVTKEICF